jgi:RHS repeat-associated protein
VSGTNTGFLYDRLNMVQELTSGSPSVNILPGLGIDEWLMRTDSAGTRHFLTDAVGSTVALANGSGGVVTEYTGQPFGQTTTSGSASSNPFQFTGRENDGTGLFHYRARYFSPQAQRFTSEDPLGLQGGLNMFAYANNAPNTFIDPLGLKPNPLFGPLRWLRRLFGGPPGPPGGPNAPAPPGRGPNPPRAPKPPDKDRPPRDRCPGGPDGWFRPASHDYSVGRPGSIVEPGRGIGAFLDDYVPAGHVFGTSHDAFVGDMTARGFPDWLVNIPSMPFAYAAETLNQAARSLGGDHWSHCH